jgi:poly-gamma-glutamate synthesis protein (capsule biosynthesis protein)
MVVKINFLGDLFVSNFNSNFKEALKSFKKIYKEGDINFINLEAPVNFKGIKNSEKCALNMDLKNLEFLIDELKINVVNLANNHIFDYGLEGFSETIEFLKEKNIAFFGAGKNLEEARKPLIIKLDQISVAFLGYSWDFIQSLNASKDTFGTSPLEENLILEDIKKIRGKCDFLIVSLHWSYEREIYPLPSHRRLAHKIINAGADFIVGHHSHVPQGVELYNNKPIAYSLGNFYFDNYNDGKWNLIQDKVRREGILFELFIGNKINIKYKFFAHNFKNYQIIHKDFLNVPLSLTDEEYLKFWRKNRIRKDYPDMFGIYSKYGRFLGNLFLGCYKFIYNSLYKTNKIKRLFLK